MSGMVGAALPVTIHMVDDQRIVHEDLDVYTSLLWQEVTILTFCKEPLFLGDTGCFFATAWWPASSGLLDVGALDDAWSVQPYSWGTAWPNSGANGRFSLSGYARDFAGQIVTGAAVKLFRTSDDSLQASVTSDANGYYLVTSPFADGHYLVVYKAGPPDVCGTTVNTLAPS
jgi:hypothetical protein